MIGSNGSVGVEVALSASINGKRIAAPWATQLVDLGGRVRRYVGQLKGRQLIVVISVPSRELAAGLVGCGWVIASPPCSLKSPSEFLSELSLNTPVRLVTPNAVIADRFLHLERHGTIVRLSKWPWLLSGVKAVGAIPDFDSSARTDRPGVGAFGARVGLADTWDEHLASPSAKLAIVGTLKWLQEDFQVFLYPLDLSALDSSDREASESDRLGGLLLPKVTGAATWFSRIYAASRLAQELPLPGDVRGVILDGTGAIKHVSEIEAGVVICILDRSVADETAAEILVQLRNTRGEPVSLERELGWIPPQGIEGLSFTVAL